MLNMQSLAIGIAVGAGASLAAVFVFLQAIQTFDNDNATVLVSGVLKEVSGEALWIDQTFNQTALESNRAVKVQPGQGTALR